MDILKEQLQIQWHNKLLKNKTKNEKKTSSKGPPVKVLWYLPIIPRFKRLFANEDDAKDLTWHANGRISDGLVCHPADCSKWKKIDGLYPDFGKEPRNL